MPNWCENTVTFRGTAQEIETFCVYLKTGLFNGYIPIDCETDPNWHNHRVERWGTKWDIMDSIVSESSVEILEKGPDFIQIEFQTAWSPPIAFYRHLCSLGMEVEASFVEHGVGFCGRFYAGDVVSGNYEEEFPEDWDDINGSE